MIWLKIGLSILTVSAAVVIAYFAAIFGSGANVETGESNKGCGIIALILSLIIAVFAIHAIWVFLQ